MASMEVYYYSGTGNSLHIASELRKRIPEAELIPILRFANADRVITKSDTVGFVFPQYASMAPKAVIKLLDKFDFGGATYIFSVTVRGGTDCWTFLEMDELLRRKGKSLGGNFVVTMPSGSSPILKSFAERTNETENRKREAAAMQELDRICRAVAERRIARERCIPGRETAPPILKPFVPALLKFAKHVENRFDFYYDEKCSGCGVCERVCLAGKVKMQDRRPSWNAETTCLACWACFNFCPERSIQIKSKWYLKSYTALNGRYHHPSVSAGDIAAQKA
jgi:NAD-dependent dihydropyrimidine dehydrogenase PreA subunit